MIPRLRLDELITMAWLGTLFFNQKKIQKEYDIGVLQKSENKTSK